MRTKILSLLVVCFLISVASSAQNNSQKNDPVGTWKFDAPYAPEGYTSGVIVVGKEEQKYTVAMSFTGYEYKFVGEKVKFEKDIVSFSIYLEGENISVTLKFENATKMTGKAVYSEGEVPLTLTKTPPGK